MLVGADQPRARQKDDASVGADRHQRLDERLGFDHARLGRPQSRDARHRWLACDDERAIDQFQPFHAIFVAAHLERFELPDLSVVVRDDQLAGLTVRHVVAGAERVHQPSPFDAQPGLQRSGWVVDARVNDPAVVCAGVETRARVPFEDACRMAARRERPRRGQSGHAGTDDCDVDVGQRVSPVDRVSLSPRSSSSSS
jgi:hypothetical protein